MICSERKRLTEEYFACIERFRDAVLMLFNVNGAEFERIYRSSEECRMAMDQARLALMQHRVEHGC